MQETPILVVQVVDLRPCLELLRRLYEHRGVCDVPEKACTMRATRLLILGAASHVCCGQSLYHRRDFDTISTPHKGNGRRMYSRPPQAGRREAPRSWFVSGGGAEEADDEPHARWWRSRKRWAKRRAEKKAAEEEHGAAASSGAAQMARKRVIAIQGMLRRLKRLLGFIVDITTLKRLRLLRQARQVGAPLWCVCFVCSMQSE